MNVQDIVDQLPLEAAAGRQGLSREISGGYCGDLLSDVMGHAVKGAVWITIQGHQNIIAVAVLRELAAVILANGRSPEEDTVARADKEGIPVLVSSLGAFDLAGRLCALGIGSGIE